MDGYIQQVIAWLGNFAATAITGIEATSRQIAATLNGLVSTITAQMSTMLTSLINSVNSFNNAMKAWVDSVIQWTSTITNQLIQLFQTGLGTLVDGINRFINTAVAGAQATFNQLTQTVSAWITQASNAVTTLIGNALTFMMGTFNTVVDAIRQSLTGFLTLVTNAIANLADTARAVINQMVAATNGLIEGINTRLTDIRDGFADAAIELVKGLGNIADAEIAPLRSAIVSIVDGLQRSGTQAELADMSALYRTVTSAHSLALKDRAEAERFWQGAEPKNVIMRTVFLLLSTFMTVWTTMGGVSSANAEVIRQEFALTYPHQLLSQADTLALYQRGTIGVELAVLILRKHGLSQADADKLLTLTRTHLPPGEILASWLRGDMADDQLQLELRQLGYNGDDQSRLRSLSKVIPPLGDLITIAVKEGFNTEARQQLGLDREFPEEFKVWAGKQGLSEEWARRYWAAHWNLPSAGQMLEMYQRRIFKGDRDVELDTGLKALDVSPYWRDKIKSLAFNVMTRVDVRRMHQLGIYTDADLNKAYEDMGYSPEDAQLLREFTISLNRSNHPVDDEELGRLTRTQILGFLTDDLITPDRASTLLQEMGMTPEAAALYVQSVLMDEQRRERKDAASFIIEKALAGLITYQDAQSELSAVGLETREVQRALLQLTRAQDRKTKLPTRAEGEKMARLKVITLEQYKQLLDLLGYAPVWVDAYARLVQLGGTSD